MKGIQLFFLTLICITLNFSMAKAAEIASTKDVAKIMSEAWCEKLEQCDKESGMDLKECKKILKKSFQQGFDNTAGGKKVEVSKEKLDQCSSSIKTDTCEALKNAQSLPGCGFITYLNRY